METTTEPVQPSPPAQHAGESLTYNRRIPTVLYGLAILLFLLPFVDIKCNNEKLAQASGIDLAFGFEPKMAGTLGGLSDAFGGNRDQRNSFDKKQDPNKYALGALVLGALGFAISFGKFKARPTLLMIIGGLAVIALIALMIDVKSNVRTEASHSDDGFDVNVRIAAEFTIAYFLSLFSFIVVTILGYKQRRKPT